MGKMAPWQPAHQKSELRPKPTVEATQSAAHAAMAIGYVADIRRQNVEVALDVVGNFGAGHERSPTGSQLDGQGQVFDQLADTVASLKIDLPSFSVLTPLPGTKLYEDTRSDLISDNPELYDCYHSLFRTRLPLREFYYELAKLLEVTAKRPSCGARDDGSSVFYFSNNGAFQKMIETVKEGYQLNTQIWNPEIANYRAA